MQAWKVHLSVQANLICEIILVDVVVVEGSDPNREVIMSI
jgi:hypothetical protein